MSNLGTSVTNYDYHTLIHKRHDQSSISYPPIFILCDSCYWCATYLDKTRIPRDNGCPQCGAHTNSELTSLPIVSNESFAFNYNDKREIDEIINVADTMNVDLIIMTSSKITSSIKVPS